MVNKWTSGSRRGRKWLLCAGLSLVSMLAASPTLHPQASAPDPPKGQTQSPAAKPGTPAGQAETGETHITPDEAKQLFALVDQLMQFSSQETGLPIKSTVKREIRTRAEVESYLTQKFNEDEDAKRLQRSEIVLKKFGLLDKDFDLKPFLLDLLKEQIEAYYDSKTKTVNLLDWVSVDEQKPVLAHELTHALQDQHVDLEKWSDQTPDDVSTNYEDDLDHLAKDEMDTAREAVTEGQATAVMMDNILKPMGKSLIKDPEVVDFIKQNMTGSDSSPVMARAPLLLSVSLLFPYKEGLSFEQDIWMDKGQTAAFAGMLDHPPTSSWEIFNPRVFEQHKEPSVPKMPDIHPLVDKIYRPYDIGQIGELDVQILTQLFGGDQAARDLTPAWDGGIYWAGQRLDATPAEQKTTKSISYFYFSKWKSEASAESFAQLYADSLGRKYSGLHREEAGQTPVGAPAGSVEQVYGTDEGPVVITRLGKQVFVSESFDLPLERKLATLLMVAQEPGEMKMAGKRPDTPMQPDLPTLSGGLVHLFSDCGVMKAAVDAEIEAAGR